MDEKLIAAIERAAKEKAPGRKQLFTARLARNYTYDEALEAAERLAACGLLTVEKTVTTEAVTSGFGTNYMDVDDFEFSLTEKGAEAESWAEAVK